MFLVALPAISYSQSALQFNGTNQYVTFGNDAILGTENFTLEAWIKKTGSGTTIGFGDGVNICPVISKGSSEGDSPSNINANYLLAITSDNKLAAEFEDKETPGANYKIIGVNILVNNTWNHVAVTFDKATKTWNLYINGALDKTETISGTHTPESTCLGHAGLATRLTSTGTASGFFQGIIDEPRIWNYARSQSQIQAGMCAEITSGAGLLGRWGLNEGSGTIASNSVSGNPDGTLTNGPSWTSDMPFNTSWVAYNDLAWGSGQLEGNITKITSPNGGSGYPSSASLIKYNDGNPTGVTLTISGGTYTPGEPDNHANDGRTNASVIGDAKTYFHDKLTLQGTISYQNEAPPEGNLVLTFTGLSPAKLYNIIFYADRNGYGWDRASLVTISGEDGFVNQSSIGIDNNSLPLFSDASDHSTRLPADNANGYVARFTNINAGSDGEVLLTVSFDGITSAQYRGKYASALMVEEYSTSSSDDPEITLISPDNGETNVNPFALLKVKLSNISSPQDVVFYIKDKGSYNPFRMINLGDTQFYTVAGDTAGHAMFASQTNWIVQHRIDSNIVYVLHIGDLVQNYDEPDALAEWTNVAVPEMNKLDDAGIPYGIEVAGHDRHNQDPKGNNRTDNKAISYNTYFGVDHFYGYPYYGGFYNG